MSPNISILIVDDSIEKIISIINVINKNENYTIKIDQAISIVEALSYLEKNKYHLLISDILMPYDKDSELLEEGGNILIKEIYRKSRYNVPLFIMGLTQYDEFLPNFKKIWNVYKFNKSAKEWEFSLVEMINHIDKVKSNLLQFITETIFVEGINDYKILNRTCQLYYSELIHLFKIEYVNFGGGTDWVERNIIIWSHALNKNEDGNYIKAIGLFDNDPKGLKSVDNLKSKIKEHSAESKCFSILKTSYKYSTILKSIKNKGLTFFTTMEDLISIEVWKYAQSKDWLTLRSQDSYDIESVVNEEYLNELSFNEDEKLITLYKIKDEYKNDFTNYSLQKSEYLLNVSYLLKECLTKLKLQ